MTAAKKPPSPVTNIGANIEHCTIQNGSVANEFTRDAVVALAGAVKANADAIIAAANALRGAPATMTHGIHLSHLTGTGGAE